MPRRSLFSSDVPFSPKKMPIHYGWIIAAVAIFGFWASIPGHSMGVNVFTEKLITALNLSRTEISATFFVGTFLSALALPSLGKLYDVWGVRILSVMAGFALALSLTYLSYVDTFARALEELLPEIVTDRWIRLVTLSLGFFSLRLFGDGTLAFCARNMISKWWERRRGRVLSAVGIVATISYSIAPQVFNASIEAMGWRETWRLMALIIGVGFTTLAWLFFRDSPQDCQLQADAGLPVPDKNRDDPEFILKKEFTRSEALKQYAFWCFALIFFGHSCFYTGYVFHVVDVAASMGVEKEEMLQLFLPSALLAGVVNLGTGWASDHIRLKWILLFMASTSAIGALALGFASGELLKIGFIIGFGMSAGCFVTLAAAFVARFFGLMHLGAISGFLTSLILLGGAIGPLLLSLFNNWLGSYRTVSVLAAIGFLLVALGSFWANNPQRDRE